jgi:Transposase DNA-binding/Transposase Tn5 dimerisation domain
MKKRRKFLGTKREGLSTSFRSNRWMGSELARCEFRDTRHGKRLQRLLEQLSEKIGGSIPWACQDWANTKAAYRFFSNDRVSEEEILGGHFQATRDRLAAHGVLILMLHDTTEFTFHRHDVEPIGILHKSHVRKDKEGRPRHYTVCGMLMHSSLAVTPEGLPLGLAAIKFWTRDQFKGCNALKKKINPTRVPIEQKESYRWLENVRQTTALLDDPQRCVHIGDRESDIYELFCAAQKAGTHFLLRTCVDRLAGDGNHTIADEMQQVRVQGMHRIQGRDKKGSRFEAVLEIRYRRIRVLPPIGKQKQYPALMLTVIHAQERGTPQERERVDWKLITNLPVHSRRDAIEKLEWYAQRWKIETFHKILKSGCKAEESKLRTAERLVNLIAVLCLLSWRVFWMTMVNRAAPDAPPELAFTQLELRLLDELVRNKADVNPRMKSLTAYLTKLARLGGYLARASDSPPGNTVMWRGLSRLTDIELGATIGAQLVGN